MRPIRTVYRHILYLLLVVGCAGPRPERGGVEPAAYDHCTASLAPRSFQGRPVVEARCRFPAFTLAGHRTEGRKLASLHRSGRPLDQIDDRELRATAEFRSYMEPKNVWQWGDRVRDAEALVACRLMLAELRAGRRIDWDAQARAYLNQARQALAAAAQGAPGRSVR